ncbi:PLC-like phosphodiesterase [Delitschia confertaspora ATCC 74209]|uniref:Phosphoinositide phospholipase C n=1 Tax=Delitschia confertaspora ATCC 74209 TaxID=1513339 RepID=A0A9P4MLB7_9PLEO|nr:PLC-like phosphodiesterase [Delitschia confertaspora ATCC 74209]
MATPSVPAIEPQKAGHHRDSKLGTPKLDQPQLQAGGGSAAASSDTKIIDYLSPIFSNYLKILYEDLGKRYGVGEGLKQWLQEEQHAPEQDAEKLKDGSFSVFANYLSTVQSNALQPLDSVDSSYPISNYFVSSSHNTYLTGNQLSSESSVDAYKNVLLRGCRCVEIDVWDGEPPSSSSSEDEAFAIASKGKKEKPELSFRKRLELRFGRKGSPPPEEPPVSVSPPKVVDRIQPWRSNSSTRAEPRVLHGYTLTKDTPFRAVCATIRDYAFVTSDLPVIISLEVHTSPEQQEIMVEIMTEYWKGMLVDLPLDPSQPSDELALPTLDQLRKKILVKVKYTPAKPPAVAGANPTTLQAPSQLTKTASVGSIASSTSSSSSDLPGGEKKPPAPKAKITEALGKLGIYTRSYHFHSLDQPEAKIPTHIFSLSEKSLLEVHETQPEALFNHNKHFFMRAYPKGLRLNSSNLDPSIFWRTGVQIVALNWQCWDSGMMLNEAMFAGSNGWILKPEGYRSGSISSHQKSAIPHHNLDLSIEFFAGQDIPLPPEEDDPKDFKPYVKIELHVEKHEERAAEPISGGGRAKGGQVKLKTKTRRTPNPDFEREVVKFEGVRGVTEELTFISRFKVMDDERIRDDLAAWACFRLDRLREGLRLIHLYDSNGVVTKGVLLVRIRKTVSAA